MGYDGDVIFYAGRAARLGGLPYPRPAGLTEADVSHVIGRAYRREPVSSGDGRILRSVSGSDCHATSVPEGIAEALRDPPRPRRRGGVTT
jgi:hypothetical protein